MTSLVPKPQLCRNVDQVVQNIAKFQSEISQNEGNNILVHTLSQFRAWYAHKVDGKWIFAPSKVVGYQNMDVTTYAGSLKTLDGRQTELALKNWFEPISDPDLESKLVTDLDNFLSKFGKTPSRLARISVKKELNASAGTGMVEALLTMYRTLSVDQQKEFRRRLS